MASEPRLILCEAPSIVERRAVGSEERHCHATIDETACASSRVRSRVSAHTVVCSCVYIQTQICIYVSIQLQIYKGREA